MDSDAGALFPNDQANKKEAKSAIKRKAIRFSKIVSLVGIRHATDYRNSSFRRCIWMAWLVFGFGFAVYQIQDRITHYFAYPSSFENSIEDGELLLPQVTICSGDPLEPKKMKEKGIQQYVEEIQKILSNSNESTSELNEKLQELHNITQDWRNLSKALSMTAKDTVIKVSFDGIENRSYIEEVVTDMGHCFAFSTKSNPLLSKRGGAEYGLIVVLSLNRDKYPPSAEPGFKMLINDPNEIYPRLKESGFTLKPGHITRVAVSMRHVILQGEPYDNCNKEENDYKVANCQAEEDFNLFGNQCGCIDIFMNNNRTNVTYCSYAQILNCTIVAERLRSDYLSQSKSTPKSNPCKPQRYSRIYTESVTTSSFPLLMNEMSNIPGDAQILDRIRVYVYYPHLSYMKSESVPAYKVDELICDISGALSLLLGATLLTVYEASEFFCLFARDYFQLRLAK